MLAAHTCPASEIPFDSNGNIIGEGDDAPAISVTMRDERCSMVNLDPDSASPAPEVMKPVGRANQNNAGIYGAVTRIGRLAIGQTILLREATEKRERGYSKQKCPRAHRKMLGAATGAVLSSDFQHACSTRPTAKTHDRPPAINTAARPPLSPRSPLAICYRGCMIPTLLTRADLDHGPPQ
jgi:hypothetical protein